MNKKDTYLSERLGYKSVTKLEQNWACVLGNSWVVQKEISRVYQWVSQSDFELVCQLVQILALN